MVMKNAPEPELSVIIVSYNVAGFLNHCLDSVVRACSGFDAEVLVVDNSSTDNTADMVRNKYPGVTLIENPRNLGYTRANNQGLAAARGRYVLFLNPDTILPHDALSLSMAFLRDHPDAGLLSLKLVNSDGTFQAACRRGFPTPMTAFYRMIGLSRLFPGSRRFGRYNLTYLDPNATAEVDAVCGAYMMARGDLLRKLGGFDETFFMYGEDIDLCWRVRREGYRVFYHPAAEVIHFKGESSRKNRIESAIHFYNSMFIFSRKYFSERMSFLPRSLLFIGIFLNALLKAPAEWASRFAAIFIDLGLMNAALTAALLIKFGISPGFYGFTQPEWALLLHGSLSFSFLTAFAFSGFYTGKPHSMTDYTRTLLVGSLLFFSFAYFIPNVRVSRMVFGATCAGLFVLLPGWRFLFSRIAFRLNTPLSRRRRWIVVGHGALGRRVQEKLSQEVSYAPGFEGFIRVAFEDTETGAHKILGDLPDLPDLARKKGVNEIILASRDKEKIGLTDLISFCARNGINLKMVESLPGQDRYTLLDVGVAENILL